MDNETDKISIVTYNPRLKADFVRLNTEWISQFFRIEESDLKTFEHIDSYIIERGGQIFFALDADGTAAGCCALIPHPELDSHELAKMAVSPHYQGHGIGLRLGTALISYAHQHGVRRIYLEGNTKLTASIKLYRHLGFKEVELEGQKYERCDILMELHLSV